MTRNTCQSNFNSQIDNTAVYRQYEPDSWTFVKPHEIGQDVEEIVFHCQGVLRGVDLPPIRGSRYVRTYTKQTAI